MIEKTNKIQHLSKKEIIGINNENLFLVNLEKKEINILFSKKNIYNFYIDNSIIYVSYDKYLLKIKNNNVNAFTLKNFIYKIKKQDNDLIILFFYSPFDAFLEYNIISNDNIITIPVTLSDKAIYDVLKVNDDVYLCTEKGIYKNNFLIETKQVKSLYYYNDFLIKVTEKEIIYNNIIIDFNNIILKTLLINNKLYYLTNNNFGYINLITNENIILKTGTDFLDFSYYDDEFVILTQNNFLIILTAYETKIIKIKKEIKNYPKIGYLESEIFEINPNIETIKLTWEQILPLNTFIKIQTRYTKQNIWTNWEDVYAQNTGTFLPFDKYKNSKFQFKIFLISDNYNLTPKIYNLKLDLLTKEEQKETKKLIYTNTQQIFQPDINLSNKTYEVLRQDNKNVKQIISVLQDCHYLDTSCYYNYSFIYKIRAYDEFGNISDTETNINYFKDYYPIGFSYIQPEIKRYGYQNKIKWIPNNKNNYYRIEKIIDYKNKVLLPVSLLINSDFNHRITKLPEDKEYNSELCNLRLYNGDIEPFKKWNGDFKVQFNFNNEINVKYIIIGFILEDKYNFPDKIKISITDNQLNTISNVYNIKNIKSYDKIERLLFEINITGNRIEIEFIDNVFCCIDQIEIYRELFIGEKLTFEYTDPLNILENYTYQYYVQEINPKWVPQYKLKERFYYPNEIKLNIGMKADDKIILDGIKENV